MKHVPRIVPAIALLSLLAGTCDQVHYARLQDDSSADAPVFVIGSNPDYSGRTMVYAVSFTGTAWDSLGRADTTRSWHTFWEIHVDSAHKWFPLANLRYGALPFYFRTVTGPDSLRAGWVYTCAVRCYGLSPTVYFEVVRDRSGRRLVRELSREQLLSRVKRPG